LGQRTSGRAIEQQVSPDPRTAVGTLRIPVIPDSDSGRFRTPDLVVAGHGLGVVGAGLW
jgi:hypothetical protein